MSATELEIQKKKDKYYLRNFIVLCMEGFFFSGACTIFSPESVLPVYVSKILESPFSIALISIIYYGLDYGVYVFACPIGVNSKSPKWTCVCLCFLQRIGFLFITLSTFAVVSNANIALGIFYISLAFYAMSAGVSTPLFTQMVSVSIFKNVSSFYGTYSLFGAAGGVLGSIVYSYFLKSNIFPLDYRYTFFIGTLLSVIATLVVVFGIKEVTDDRIVSKINMKDVFAIIKDILKNNIEYRSFTIIRVIMVFADFAVPYYIVTILNKPNVPTGYAGTLTIIYLVARMVASYVSGRIGDKFNPFATILLCSVCGVVAGSLAIISTSWQLSTVMYIVLAFACSGTWIATSSATITYSKGQYVPIYSATISLLCAPAYILVSFGGATIAKIFSYQTMFAFTTIIYLITSIYSYIWCKKATNK